MNRRLDLTLTSEARHRFMSFLSGITEYEPILCLLKGREAGSVRSIRLRNGISVRERLLAISPHDRSYRYSVIESPLPIRDHESTVRLVSLNNSQTQMTWTAKFEVIEGDAKALAEGVRTGVLDLGIEGLRRAVALK